MAWAVSGALQKGAPSLTTPIHTDYGFDARGNKASETFPYYEGATAHTTTFRYDALNRMIRQTNPDETTKTFAYGIDDRSGTGFGISIPRTTVTTTTSSGETPKWCRTPTIGRSS